MGGGAGSGWAGLLCLLHVHVCLCVCARDLTRSLRALSLSLSRSPTRGALRSGHTPHTPHHTTHTPPRPRAPLLTHTRVPPALLPLPLPRCGASESVRYSRRSSTTWVFTTHWPLPATSTCDATSDGSTSVHHHRRPRFHPIHSTSTIPTSTTTHHPSPSPTTTCHRHCHLLTSDTC